MAAQLNFLYLDSLHETTGESWKPAICDPRRAQHKAPWISLNHVFSNVNTGEKIANVGKGGGGDSHSVPRSDPQVSSRSLYFYAIFLVVFKSEELPAVCACVCVHLWGPGMKPTATASSDLMQKAAGSSTIHYSLCVPRPSPVITVSPVTKHIVTLGRGP